MKLIAEIGLNHLGDEELALQYVKALIKKPLDGISFQIRENSFYDGSELFQRKLNYNFYDQASKIIRKANKDIGFAIAEISEVERFLSYKPAFWKTLSWDLDNAKLQSKLSLTNVFRYVSTGISDMKSLIEFSNHNSDFNFIHTCLSNEVQDQNLSCLISIPERTSIKSAFGLHCKLSLVASLSVMYSPSAIFFYVKLDSEKEYPDDVHAISFKKMDLFLQSIIDSSASLGVGTKHKKEIPEWVVK